MNATPLNQDINYLQGQLHGLQALLLGIANLVLDKENFRNQSLARLAVARDALLSQPVQEPTLAGIDAIEGWLLHVTQ